MVTRSPARSADPLPLPVLDPAAPLAPAFRAAVGSTVTAFLAEQEPVLRGMGPELEPLRTMAAELLDGGKRLRPAFCVWGYVAAAGLPDAATLAALVRAAASLDLLHVSALVHDDVMDSSDLRRGRPAAHRQFEAQHAAADLLGDPGAFGRAGAILLGDLLLMWSAELLLRSGMAADALARATPVAEAMRTEVTCGQYLDIVAQARPLRADPSAALAEAGRVVEYKSARYTVQRPCQLGAALGGGDPGVQEALASFGSPAGRAFQFRDDVLGVFGDSAVTGKPAGDDLREGKRTVLVAHAYAGTDAAGRALLEARLGDPDLDADGVAALQDVLVSSGAVDAVETMIADGHAAALAALEDAPITDDGRRGLTALAEAAVRRQF
ncbi:polyprenyl synthetase family protein [Microlunatus lacustris]